MKNFLKSLSTIFLFVSFFFFMLTLAMVIFMDADNEDIIFFGSLSAGLALLSIASSSSSRSYEE